MKVDVNIKIKKGDEVLTKEVVKNGTNAYIYMSLKHVGKKAKVIILE